METAAQPDLPARPLKVFVLGPARSGTSILLLGLRKVFGLSGYGESHVMPIFARMLRSFELYRENLPPKVGVKDLRNDQLMTGFRATLRDYYTTQFPHGRWIDKTPGAESISAIPIILDVFPRARIIITTRNGIEVVQSFTRKFSSDVEKAATAWSRAMEAIDRRKPLPDSVLTIDQFDIVNDTARIASAVATHLGEPNRAAELLDFLATERRDQRSSHDWSRRMTLADTSWTQAEKETFVQVCGPIMSAAGYPM